MWAKLKRQALRRGLPKYRFEAEVAVHSLGAWPKGVKSCVVLLSRGAKEVQTKTPASPTGGQLLFNNETLAVGVTLYQSQSGTAWDEKVYAVKARAPSSRTGKPQTFAKGTLDLSRHALLQPGSHSVSLELPLELQAPYSGVVNVKLSLTMRWLPDWTGDGETASQAGSDVSRSTLASRLSGGSLFGQPRSAAPLLEQDLSGFVVPSPETSREREGGGESLSLEGSPPNPATPSYHGEPEASSTRGGDDGGEEWSGSASEASASVLSSFQAADAHASAVFSPPPKPTPAPAWSPPATPLHAEDGVAPGELSRAALRAEAAVQNSLDALSAAAATEVRALAAAEAAFAAAAERMDLQDEVSSGDEAQTASRDAFDAEAARRAAAEAADMQAASEAYAAASAAAAEQAEVAAAAAEQASLRAAAAAAAEDAALQAVAASAVAAAAEEKQLCGLQAQLDAGRAALEAGARSRGALTERCEALQRECDVLKGRAAADGAAARDALARLHVALASAEGRRAEGAAAAADLEDARVELARERRARGAASARHAAELEARAVRIASLESLDRETLSVAQQASASAAQAARQAEALERGLLRECARREAAEARADAAHARVAAAEARGDKLAAAAARREEELQAAASSKLAALHADLAAARAAQEIAQDALAAAVAAASAGEICTAGKPHDALSEAPAAELSLVAAVAVAQQQHGHKNPLAELGNAWHFLLSLAWLPKPAVRSEACIDV